MWFSLWANFGRFRIPQRTPKAHLPGRQRVQAPVHFQSAYKHGRGVQHFDFPAGCKLVRQGFEPTLAACIGRCDHVAHQDAFHPRHGVRFLCQVVVCKAKISRRAFVRRLRILAHAVASNHGHSVAPPVREGVHRHDGVRVGGFLARQRIQVKRHRYANNAGALVKLLCGLEGFTCNPRQAVRGLFMRRHNNVAQRSPDAGLYGSGQRSRCPDTKHQDTDSRRFGARGLPSCRWCKKYAGTVQPQPSPGPCRSGTGPKKTAGAPLWSARRSAAADSEIRL